MTLPSFTDLGLAAVVLVLAVVPAALAMLAIIGRAAGHAARHAGWNPAWARAGFRVAGPLAALVLAALFLRFSWDWSAATHLKPLCAALAEPWFSGSAARGTGEASLRVRRRVVEAGYWTTITADRYEAVDDATGEVLAEGDELWIDAGATRYRCGLASGPLPVKRRDEPARPAIDQFLDRAAGAARDRALAPAARSAASCAGPGGRPGPRSAPWRSSGPGSASTPPAAGASPAAGPGGRLRPRRRPASSRSASATGTPWWRWPRKSPGRNFLGAEVHAPGVGHCLLAIERLGLTNVRLLMQDAVEVLRERLPDAQPGGRPPVLPRPLAQEAPPQAAAGAAGVRCTARRAARARRLLPRGDGLAGLCSAHPGGHGREPGLPGRPATDGSVAGAGHRPRTRFEARGERLGHPIWEAVYLRSS